jgi:DDE_Tnp_1-associated
LRNKIPHMIQTFISYISDPRRKAGTRYSFESLMTIILLGTCMGYIGYRELYRFVKNNSDYLIPELNLTHGIPCHNTFRRLLQKLKAEDIITAFNAWCKVYYPIDGLSALGTDGQVLRETVTNHDNKEQDFVSIVSLFASKTGITHAIQSFNNKKTSEISIVADLLGEFLEEKIPVLQQADALHSKKND